MQREDETVKLQGKQRTRREERRTDLNWRRPGNNSHPPSIERGRLEWKMMTRNQNDKLNKNREKREERNREWSTDTGYAWLMEPPPILFLTISYRNEYKKSMSYSCPFSPPILQHWRRHFLKGVSFLQNKGVSFTTTAQNDTSPILPRLTRKEAVKSIKFQEIWNDLVRRKIFRCTKIKDEPNENICDLIWDGNKRITETTAEKAETEDRRAGKTWHVCRRNAKNRENGKRVVRCLKMMMKRKKNPNELRIAKLRLCFS